MNKSFYTNLICLLTALAGYFLPDSFLRGILLGGGLFGLSGAVTNWLAIQMIFEKVPFIYGSGVVILRFESFKSAIRDMIMRNFFNEENFEKIKKKAVPKVIDTQSLISKINLDLIFEEVKSMVVESSIGPMLGFLGGESALEQFRPAFKEKISERLPAILANLEPEKLAQAAGDYEKMKEDIEAMVDSKLAELTPKHVKEIVEKMIKEHLGWLVVWGGVFGGLMGAFGSFAF